MKTIDNQNDLQNTIIQTLTFFDAIEKPLTALELYRNLSSLQNTYTFDALLDTLEDLIASNTVLCESGFYSLQKKVEFSMKRRNRDVLLHKKWRKFLRYQKLFTWIPFVDFVMGSGSLALGNVIKDSDFDVLVAVRHGRIFTARFFSIFIFGVLGIRRSKIDHEETARDKVCFNHFITRQSYKLEPPYDIQWRALYKNFVPLIGSLSEMQKFMAANTWMFPAIPLGNDLRFKPGTFSYIKLLGERVLRGQFGNYVESFFKKIQIKRIQKNLPRKKRIEESRIRFNDNELEFHPDLTKINELLHRIGERKYY